MPELYDMNRPGREPGMKKVSSNMIIIHFWIIVQLYCCGNVLFYPEFFYSIGISHHD